MKHLTILFQILLCNILAIGQRYVLQTTNGGIRLSDGAITQAKVQGLSDSLSAKAATNHNHNGVYQPVGSYLVAADIAGKQNTLVSGTNIKTINGSSVLGSGDLVINSAASFGSITGQPSDNANLVTALNTRLAIAGNGSQLTGLTKGQVGLGNVDNTADIDKPISAATQTALNAKQNTITVLPFANGGISGAAATSATTGAMTVNMTSSVITITPTGNCTFNASGGVAGQIVTFVVTTSGTSSFTLTFGTNFRKTGTLATGTTSARFFAVTFRCIDGTIWMEIGRTSAQT